MKVLIVEEGLESHRGHYFQYLRDLADDGRVSGHEIDILAHRNASYEVTDPVGAVAWLSRSVHHGSFSRNRLGRLGEILKHNRILHQDICSWHRHSGKRYDATIIPSARIEHIWALHRLRHTDRERHFGHLFAIMVDAPGVRVEGGTYRFPSNTWPLRFSIRWISNVRSSRPLTFAAESERMVQQFKKFSGVNFIEVPHVTRIPPEAAKRIDPAIPQRIRFGTFGFTRYDKGLDVLQEAIKQLPSDWGDNMEFVLQWTQDYSLPCGRLIKQDSALQENKNVSFISAFKDSREYYDSLAQTDVVALPYRRDFYSDRMSRVAVDAALAGIPTVFPRDTWLEDFHEDYGSGVAFTADDPASLARAILEVRLDYLHQSKVAIDRMQKTRHDFSGAAFFSIIQETLNAEK